MGDRGSVGRFVARVKWELTTPFKREFWRGFFGFFYPPLLPPGEHLFDRWFRRGR